MDMNMLYYLYMMKNIKNNFIVYSVFGLEILAASALAISMGAMLLSPIMAHAQESDGVNVTFGDPSARNNTNSGSNNVVTNPNPVPVINSINPTAVMLNSGSDTITITGSNFIRSSVVRLNGSDRATTYVNSGKLTAQLNHGDTTTLGTHSVTVYNPGPGGGSSNITYLNIKSNTVAKASTSTAAKSTTRTTTSTSNSGGSFIPSNTGDDLSLVAGNAIFGSNSFMPTGLVQWILFAILILLIVIITRKIFVGDDEKNRPLKHA